MLSLRTIIALASISLLASANPFPGTTSADAHTPFPIATLDRDFSPASAGLTLPGAAPPSSLAARQEFPATLLTCTSTNCAAGCTSWTLADRGDGNCFFAGQFVSVAIEQPSNQGLPFSVDIAPANCENWLAIPAVNTCFNINGGPFEQFGVDDI